MSDPAYTCHFLDEAAHRAAEDARMALAYKRQEDEEWRKANNAFYGWASLHEVTGPCPMWFLRWLFDPADPDDAEQRENALKAIREGTFDVSPEDRKAGKPHFYLSRDYWVNWSDKRPPICVLCPNGKEWCVNSISSNGDGWIVTGDPPKLTCNPSILVPGYHGHLRDGVFTPNM